MLRLSVSLCYPTFLGMDIEQHGHDARTISILFEITLQPSDFYLPRGRTLDYRVPFSWESEG
jgi:hypothetical protein